MSEIDERYNRLAEQSLENGRLDTDAYIVKTLSDIVLGKIDICKNKSVDLVPSSRIDEHITTINDYFAKFFGDRSSDNLDKMLIKFEQVLSEIYHSLESLEEREKFKNFINKLQKNQIK